MAAMELSDLDQDERMALVALIERVVLADHAVTTDEAELLPQITEALGEEEYRKIALAADERFRDDEGLKTFLQGIKREEARELIFGTVMEVAIADAIAGNESDLLQWLGEAWKLELKVERSHEDTLEED
jgi:hypothetical protein